MRAVQAAVGILLLSIQFAYPAAAEEQQDQRAAVSAAQGDKDTPDSEDFPGKQEDVAPKPPSSTDGKGPLLPVPPKDFDPMTSMSPVIPGAMQDEGGDSRWQLTAINVYLAQLGRYMGELTLLTKWLTLAVSVGGLFLIALLWFVRGNARELRKLASCVDIHSDIAEKQLAQMKETAERQLRAYVYTNGAKGELLQDKSGKYVARVEIRNFGRTPAYGLNGWMSVFVGDSGAEKDMEALPHDLEVVETILPPGGVCFYYARTNESILPEIKAISRDTRAIYVYGEVRYKDVSGIERYARFRIKCAGERNLGSGSFEHCFAGNEAN